MRITTETIAARSIARLAFALLLPAWLAAPAWAFRWDLSGQDATGQSAEDQARLIDEEAASAADLQRQVGQERHNQRMEAQRSMADDLVAEAARRRQLAMETGRIAAEHANLRQQQAHLFAMGALTLTVVVSGVLWIRKRQRSRLELS